MVDKATEQELAEIHGGMAQWCKLVLQGTPMRDSEGNFLLKPDGTPYLEPPSSAHLNVIRQFLKDNKIDSPKTGEKIVDIPSELPDFKDETAFH